MRHEDIREFQRRQPFVPYRITLTDGRTYDVLHPELAMVGYSSMLLGQRRADEMDVVYDRFVTVSIAHVMQIEELTAAQKPNNGSA